ncbi:MAG: response regulator [Dehalococcoidales bacterium]|nr:response regulator [Dehalococcoidales bacterium]
MSEPKGTILVVDDEEAIRCILNKGLAMRGYACDEAENGEQALEKLEKKPSDLVILDINMPGRQGNEVLPDIINRFPETAVVMASGIADPLMIAQCIRDGAHDYIKKPFRFEQVLQSVNGTLDKRQIEIEVQRYLRDAKREAERTNTDPRKIFAEAIESLINALESTDAYIKGHSRRVAALSVEIGRHVGLSPEELEDLRWAALLHDVGRIAVDPEILNKPGELTASEYRHIMTHAVIGPRLVRPFVNDSVVRMISHHHDRYDGSGLGQKVRGKDIPLGARIIAVADAYQAMISDRPYRPAMSKGEAVNELMWYSGSQFDPIIANICVGIVQTCTRMDA